MLKSVEREIQDLEQGIEQICCHFASCHGGRWRPLDMEVPSLPWSFQRTASSSPFRDQGCHYRRMPAVQSHWQPTDGQSYCQPHPTARYRCWATAAQRCHCCQWATTTGSLAQPVASGSCAYNTHQAAQVQRYNRARPTPLRSPASGVAERLERRGSCHPPGPGTAGESAAGAPGPGFRVLERWFRWLLISAESSKPTTAVKKERAWAPSPQL